MKTEMTVETFKAETDDVSHTHVHAHDLGMLKDVLNGVYGSEVKGRLGYNLNFLAQSVLRATLKHETTLDEASYDELHAVFGEDELAQYFGFDQNPEFTLNEAVKMVMTSYVLAMDIAKITEANKWGMKSKPYAWIEKLVRTPIQMIKSDAVYAVQQKVVSQRANMVALGLGDDPGINAALEKFEKKQLAEALIKVHQKVDLVKPEIDTHYYKNLETQQLHEDIEEMCADLGLNVPHLLKEMANKARDGARKRAMEGEFVGEPDNYLMELAGEVKAGIGTGKKEVKEMTPTNHFEKAENPDVAEMTEKEVKAKAKQRRRVKGEDAK